MLLAPRAQLRALGASVRRVKSLWAEEEKRNGEKQVDFEWWTHVTLTSRVTSFSQLKLPTASLLLIIACLERPKWCPCTLGEVLNFQGSMIPAFLRATFRALSLLIPSRTSADWLLTPCWGWKEMTLTPCVSPNSQKGKSSKLLEVNSLVTQLPVTSKASLQPQNSLRLKRKKTELIFRLTTHPRKTNQIWATKAPPEECRGQVAKTHREDFLAKLTPDVLRWRGRFAAAAILRPALEIAHGFADLGSGKVQKWCEPQLFTYTTRSPSIDSLPEKV